MLSLNVFVHSYSKTNPELLEQLWIQLYRYLPGPSMGPKLSSELSASIALSVSIDNLELLHNKNQLIT
ncbi:hypothetical protein KSF78_0006939 [Schistosoma japonicum]|nr:hypothetical protein KSF78_0006939 [Schistosoma japonicum]